MIELMIYRSGDLSWLSAYVAVFLFLCRSVWDGYNRKLRIHVVGRNEDFKKSVELAINDVLWSAINKGKITFQQAQNLGFRIMNFDWR